MTIKALKEKAKKEVSSVNAALVKLLQEELGIKKKKRTVEVIAKVKKSINSHFDQREKSFDINAS